MRILAAATPLFALVVGLWLGTGSLAAQENEPQPQRPRRGIVVPVSLPLSGSGDLQVQRMIDHVVDNLPRDAARPVLILEFRPKSGQQGEGTQLERASALARYLVSGRLRDLRTVAYVPRSVQGHGVLPILACEEIIMAPDATLGNAGQDESVIDPAMVNTYDFIATQRRTLPPAFVKAMLDKRLELVKVNKGTETLYVLGDEVEPLKKDGDVTKTEQLVPPGEPARFTGADLRLRFGFVSYLARNREELAAALKLPAGAVEDDPSLGRGWKPLLVRLDGPIGVDKVNFIMRSLDQRLQAGDANFVCVEIHSAGGSLEHSVRLAQYLSDLRDREIRTVAYVPRQARGDAALVAIACDHLVMTEEARIGGAGEINLDPRLREDLRETVREIMQDRARGWSLPLALVDRELSVFRYTHQNDQRVAYFSELEHSEQENPAEWQKGGELATRDGLLGRQADEVELAKFLVGSFQEVKQIYHLDSEPERLQANWAHLLIEQLAKPEIAGFLLFVAFFTLSIEMMTPGVGLAGFLSAVCFLLFFWANVLHGTAGTLEILLFVAGIAFVAIELFALPGLGAFGIGGVLMIIASVVLASQTFVIPRNTYQLEQFPRALMMVTAAGAGVIISLAIVRKYLHKAPVFNRMLLPPPEGEQLGELQRRERLAMFDHLLHKRGVTLTPLTPAGKARFGDEVVDVISSGDFAPAGASVYVVEATGNRVVVNLLET